MRTAVLGEQLVQRGRRLAGQGPINVRVAAPVFATMRAHFSEQEIVESILAIGFYMTMARLTEAPEVDLDPAAGMTVFEGGKKRSG